MLPLPDRKTGSPLQPAGLIHAVSGGLAERKRSKNTEHSYPGEKARQGDIVLGTPAERWIFIDGLVAAVVVGTVLTWLDLRH
jgi:hypothetical protein